MNRPTEEAWRSEEWGLDEASAYRRFHGKTVEEVVRLFEIEGLIVGMEYKYIPRRAFGYYLKSYMAYLTSEAARGDSDSAGCFIDLISDEAEHQRENIVSLWSEIEPVLKRLAEHQDDYEALWEIDGSFRARIHAIVQQGFVTSFDTTLPEVVPEGVTLHDCSSLRPLPLAVAVQLFQNSGIDGIDANSKKSDVLRVFGPPDASGGGEDCKYGFAEWIRYDRLNHWIRFEIDGDAITNVTIMRPDPSDGLPLFAEIDPEVRAKQIAAFSAWNALFESSTHDEETKSPTPPDHKGS
jgi:hypothetical protein